MYIDLQVLTADPHRANTSRPHTTRLRCNNRGGERSGATGGGGGEGGARDESGVERGWGREEVGRTKRERRARGPRVHGRRHGRGGDEEGGERSGEGEALT